MAQDSIAGFSSSPTGLLDVHVSGEESRVILRVRGELDLSSAHQLNQELRLAELSEAREIVVDLGGLSFMDSSGLHVLLRAADREPKRLRLRPAPPLVQSVFQVTRTDVLLPFS